MLDEIRRLVGHRYSRDEVIISTNLRLRRDGEPYATQRQPEDQGVAVYFKYKGKPMVFACDQWRYIHDNMQAIAKTIEALRGIERWGASDMMERAFTGFVALEHQPEESYADVLQMGNRINKTDQEWLAEAERHFKILCKEAHPDHGGSNEELARLIKARDQARAELGGTK
ncbi:MAG: hypothetical protein AB2747_05255 [Candidatus Thiodiazotropha taylori]